MKLNYTAAIAALGYLLTAVSPASSAEIVNVSILDTSDPYHLSISIDPHGVYPVVRATVVYPGSNWLSDGLYSNIKMFSQAEFVSEAQSLGLGIDDLANIVSGKDDIVGQYNFTKMTLLRGMYMADNTVFLPYMQSLIMPNFTQPTDEPYYRDALESANWFNAEPDAPTSGFLLIGDGTLSGTEILMVTATPEPASLFLGFLAIPIIVLFRRVLI